MTLTEKAIWDGMREYLKGLSKAKAVDDIKMKFEGFTSLEECLKRWGIK